MIDHNQSPAVGCEGAHVHEVVLSGVHGSSIEVMDLGLNSVYHYSTNSLLIDTPPQQIVHMPRLHSGPRHTVIHPTASWAFVINELDSTISTLPYNHFNGQLGNISSTISTLQSDEDATDMAAGGELY